MSHISGDFRAWRWQALTHRKGDQVSRIMTSTKSSGRVTAVTIPFIRHLLMALRKSRRRFMIPYKKAISRLRTLLRGDWFSKGIKGLLYSTMKVLLCLISFR